LWLCKVKHVSIKDITGLRSETVSDYLKFYRDLVGSSFEDENDQIGGPNIVVEIDEAKFGKRKYHRGHKVEGVWVVGGVERTAEKKIFVKVVRDRSSEILSQIILEHVKNGSVVFSDMWKGYNDLKRLGFIHKTVNHSKNFKDPETGVHTNTIEGTWNGIKLGIPPRNRNKDSVSGHLIEFVWRRKNEANLWNGLLNALKTTYY
jgi:transposase-like protein